MIFQRRQKAFLWRKGLKVNPGKLSASTQTTSSVSWFEICGVCPVPVIMFKLRRFFLFLLGVSGLQSFN